MSAGNDVAALRMAADIIARAESELGGLSQGQRRDLLKDNMPLDSDTVAEIVSMLPPSPRYPERWMIAD